MANTIGRSNTYSVAAAIPIASSAVLQSLNLGGTGGIPIKKNQTIKVKYWIKLSVGATGGIRFQIAVPAAGTLFTDSFRINNTVAPAQTIGVQQSSAVVTNALANAGTHWVEITATITNGANAGTVDLQMAQNTSDALTLTILLGSDADVTAF
jgi:hypothetical protein